MKILYIIYFLFLIKRSLSYSNLPNINRIRKNLQKNIEIYETIKECNVSDITTCGEECSNCSGSGGCTCHFCHGTGFLTMGDVLIGTGNNCVVCNGTGEKECKTCMGSGYIAKWK